MKLTGLTPILNVSDIAASLAWFEVLGWRRCWTWNPTGGIDKAASSDDAGPATFAAVGCGECEIFLCRDGQGSRGGPNVVQAQCNDAVGVWMSWWLATPAEVDEVHALALQQNLAITHPPTNEPWGVRECHLRHPDGHTFRISAPLPCD